MKTKSIASFMICLIISMPIYSAIVFAGIDKVSVSGSNGIENYAKQEDTITFQATVNIVGDTSMDKEQVWLGETMEFDSCAPGIEGFECTLKYPSSGTVKFMPSDMPYTIHLYNDYKHPYDTYSSFITIDSLPPIIKEFTAPPVLPKGTVPFKFEIQDYAFSSGNANKCSGIKKIILSSQDGAFEKTIDINSNKCTYLGNISESTDSFQEGSNYVNAKAYDSLDQESASSTVSFEIDKTAPEVDITSFGLVDNYGDKISFISNNPFDVNAIVDVIGDDIAYVYGDFSGLSQGSEYSNLQAECSDIGSSVSECVWQLTINTEKTGTFNAVVRTEDSIGNKDNKTIAIDLAPDNNGPVIKSLATDRIYGGKYYGRQKNNSFTAEITEDVGLNPSDVLLRIGPSSFKADSCTSGWECKWQNIDISSQGTIKASIGTDTKDKLGNHLTAPFSIDVVMDNSPPKLINLTVQGIGGEEEAADYLKTGDTISIVAELEEDNKVANASVDASAVIANGDNLPAGNCSDDGICAWEIGPIDVSGFIDDYLYFTFEDIAGNTLKFNQMITVYGIEESEANYWKNTVTCSPSMIDRQVSPKIEQKVFCHVDLSPNSQSQDPEVMYTSLDSCESDFLKSSSIMNNAKGSADPYILLLLNKNEMTLDQIDVSCKLGITSKIGNKITKTPEVEDVNITIELYNLPLGEFSDSVQGKIDKAREEADAALLKIAKLKGFLALSEGFCKILHTLEKFVNLLGSIELTLSVLDATPANGAITTFKNFVDLQHGATAGIYKYLKGYCEFISCDRTLWGNWYNGEQSLFYNNVAKDGGYAKNGFMKAPSWLNQMHISNAQFWPNSPKESIVLSIATGCLPGMINGAEKWRQIKCNYGVCLRDSATELIPLKVCEDQKAYLECKFIFGEIFQILPYSAFFKGLLNQVTYILSDPIGLVFGATSAYCTLYKDSVTAPHALCVITKTFSLMMSVYEDIAQFVEEKGNMFKVRNDMCKELDKDEE